MKKIIKLTENDLKTLVINVISEQNELGEQTFLKGLFSGVKDAKALKVANPALFKSFDDVIKFGAAEGRQIKGLTKIDAVNPQVVTSVDDLVNAVKQGLQGKDLARFYTGLMKSSSTPKEILSSIAKELVSSEKFISQYKGMSEKQLRQLL